MTVPTLGFGPHLIIDAYDCDPEKLADIELIRDFLMRLTHAIGMNAMMDPLILVANPEDITHVEDEGPTGVIVFCESHFTFHAFPQKGFFAADIFSCKPYDDSLVRKMVAEVFGSADIDTVLILRGRRFRRSQPVSPD